MPKAKSEYRSTMSKYQFGTDHDVVVVGKRECSHIHCNSFASNRCTIPIERIIISYRRRNQYERAESHYMYMCQVVKLMPWLVVGSVSMLSVDVENDDLGSCVLWFSSRRKIGTNSDLWCHSRELTSSPLWERHQEIDSNAVIIRPMI